MWKIASDYNFPTTILHNVEEDEYGRRLGWARGYEPGDQMVEVFFYGDWGQNNQSEDPYDKKLVHAALNEAFELANILHEPDYADHPSHLTARAYRLRGVRSLSVGDMVALGDRKFVVKSFGWAEVVGDELVSI